LTPPASYGAVNSDEENDGSYEIPPSFAISLEQHFDDDDHPDSLSQKLLTRAQSFRLPHNTESLSRQLDLLLSIPLFAICPVSSITRNCYFSPFNKK
jgi:hypothetical protein